MLVASAEQNAKKKGLTRKQNLGIQFEGKYF